MESAKKAKAVEILSENKSRLDAMNDIAASLSHEIGNPLAVILGRAEMLESMIASGRLDQRTLSEATQGIQKTARRIEQLVKCLSLLTSDPSDKSQWLKAPIHEIASEALELCRARFKEENTLLTYSPIPKNLEILCQRAELVSALTCLLTNALESTHGKAGGWVALVFENKQGEFSFSIKDNGPGVPEDQQEKIFEPFFSTKRIKYGTGLGLSVARAVALKYGGDIKYERTSAQTCFRLTLPVRRT